MFAIPDEFEWLEPWRRLANEYEPCPFSDSRGNNPFEILNNELHREMPIGHELHGLDTEVVALCVWTHQDFLFVTNNPEKPIALVHLTWSKETDPTWPHTTVFRNIDEWRAEMKEWAAEWQQLQVK